jgi:hypothetical protein
MSKRQRTEPVLAVPSAADLEERIRSHLNTQPRQASQQFLVMPGLLDEKICAAMRQRLEEKHRPQTLVYSGQSSNGVSYKDAWAISTYGFVHEDSFQHKHFSERYGEPYDRDLLQFLEQSNLMKMLQVLKAAFLKVHCQCSAAYSAAPGAAAATVEAATAATTPFQIFLTIQPDTAKMAKMNSSMQPHIDPAVLTINLHFSPLDYQGAASLASAVVFRA